MSTWAQVVLAIAGGAAVLAGIGWAGLQVRPANLPLVTDGARDLGTVSSSADVPAPVQRYFHAAYGDQAPRIESLVVYGRARANFGIWLPLRYRLIHRPGQAFERYMEVTWFGWPVLRAIDRYVDGKGMTGPVNNVATGPAVDQGANLILWAEAPLMPSLWLTDDRIRWEAVDDDSARLVFPLEGGEDELMVHFDPASHLIDRISAMRYRDMQSGKIPWHADFLTWKTVNGAQVPARIAITWEDQGKPWSYWDLENYHWNVDIEQLIARRAGA